jgi:hypothetical protein
MRTFTIVFLLSSLLFAAATTETTEGSAVKKCCCCLKTGTVFCPIENICDCGNPELECMIEEV